MEDAMTTGRVLSRRARKLIFVGVTTFAVIFWLVIAFWVVIPRLDALMGEPVQPQAAGHFPVVAVLVLAPIVLAAVYLTVRFFRRLWKIVVEDA